MPENKEQLGNKVEHEPKPAVEVVPKDILMEKLRQLHEKPNIIVGMLFGGDRISCCDEGVIAEQGSKLVGLATIAPEGEQMSGQPTIVGWYVIPEYRRKGIGSQILKRAVERCIERGFNKIRMDVMSSNARRIIKNLPDELKNKIDVHDLGNIIDFIEKFTK